MKKILVSLFCLAITAITFAENTHETQENCNTCDDSGLYDWPDLTADEDIFASDEVFRVTITTDIKVLKKERQKEEYQAAKIAYQNHFDQLVEKEIELRPRGNSRLKLCSFPPIKLDLTEAEFEEAYLDNLRKVKLVTHCTNQKDAQEKVVLEYLSYKLYNLITDRSYRVRLMEITYEDAKGKLEPLTRMAFMIESNKQLLKRLGGEWVKQKNIYPEVMDHNTADKMAIFQFMIGNTDWSIPAHHNVRAMKIGEPGEEMLIPIPFDFDYAGLVDADYALPDPMFDIESVRERVYRGFCRSETEFQGLFDEFLAQKEVILSMVENNSYLSSRTIGYSSEYINDFFKILESDKYKRNMIFNNCRRPGTL
ncbi:MAG: hypothetical protein AAF502_20980 [Bacteroidota bacterium]